MQTPRKILDAHKQHYKDSCAASGMEIVLKLEGLVPTEFREFQDKYPGPETGFTKLCEMRRFGIDATEKTLNWDSGLVEIRSEIVAGRFPLASLPGAEKWHIFAAVIENDKIHFLSRDYKIDDTIDMASDDSRLAEVRCKSVNFVTYRKLSHSLLKLPESHQAESKAMC
jgi:hypothetical protein